MVILVPWKPVALVLGLLSASILSAISDQRLRAAEKFPSLIADPDARYSGAKLSVPGDNARLGETRFETWLTQPAAQIPSAPQPAGVTAGTRNKESQKVAS